MQRTESKSERDRLAEPFEKAGKYEVECLNCGHATIMESRGNCEVDTEEREYVGDGIFCIRNGDAAPVYYKKVPYICPGCSQPTKVRLRLKNDLN
jgi:hypothetical protein